MDKIIIRNAVLSDAEDIAKYLFTLVSLESIKQQILDVKPELQTMFVAEISDEVIGIGIGIYDQHHLHRHRVEVCSLVVAEKCRGQGISKLLVNQILLAAKEAGKIIAVANSYTDSNSQYTFRKCGFTEIGIMPKAVQRSWTNELPKDIIMFYKLLD